jgi:putative sigma-54 modulation protein
VQISVTGRHVEVTTDVKEYADKKLARLPRFYDRIRSVEVILGHESENFTVEVIVTADGNPFVAQEAGPDTFALIDRIVDKLERQLTRHKERFRNRKHTGAKLDRFETP